MSDSETRTEFFVNQVAPVVGMCLSTLMYFGPMYAVIEVRKRGRIGSLDPVLFAMTTPQALEVALYGCLVQNIYYTVGATVGSVLGVFYLLTAINLTTSKEQVRKVEIFLLPQLVIVAAIVLLSFARADVATQAAGYTSLLSSLALYGTPFLNLRRMIIEKDASSINRGFLFMQIVSGTMWSLYSFWDFDPFVFIPGIVSLSFGIGQTVLVIIYGRGRKRQPELAETNPTTLPNGDLEDGYHAPHVSWYDSKDNSGSSTSVAGLDQAIAASENEAVSSKSSSAAPASALEPYPHQFHQQNLERDHQVIATERRAHSNAAEMISASAPGVPVAPMLSPHHGINAGSPLMGPSIAASHMPDPLRGSPVIRPAPLPVMLELAPSIDLNDGTSSTVTTAASGPHESVKPSTSMDLASA